MCVGWLKSNRWAYSHFRPQHSTVYSYIVHMIDFFLSIHCMPSTSNVMTLQMIIDDHHAMCVIYPHLVSNQTRFHNFICMHVLTAQYRFMRVQFSWIGNLYSFAGLIFVDTQLMLVMHCTVYRFNLLIIIQENHKNWTP